MTAPDPLPYTQTGDLLLSHVLAATGADLGDVLVIRHTFNADGLTGPADLTAEKVWDYTRRQAPRRFPAVPPRLWLLFVGDGGHRSRFFGTYANHGEIKAERTDTLRTFDLHPSGFLGSLRNRLVVEWSKDAVNWWKTGSDAALFPVVEIADPAEVAFPGFDAVRIDFPTLRDVVEDHRYRSWRSALGAVQGIYLITDARTGKQYVGKADGAERILGRWAEYARTGGHGGNVALADLLGADADYGHDFRFSILRVFGPSTPRADVDTAEEHYKRALMTREFGYNRN